MVDKHDFKADQIIQHILTLTYTQQLKGYEVFPKLLKVCTTYRQGVIHKSLELDIQTTKKMVVQPMCEHTVEMCP